MMRNKTMGTIYYIGCPETSRVKIGFTAGDPYKRLRALRTGCPTDIRIFVMHPGTQEAERELHEMFADLRLHGEWFESGDALIEHMFKVCWLTAAESAHYGEKAPHWARLGLEAMGDTSTLPDNIQAAL